MKVTLIDHTTDPANRIGQAAAICYEAKTDLESNVKRAQHCVNKSHLSTLRFAYATVAIEGISRVCSHQLVRIAHAGILQESQRYVAKSAIEYVIPDAIQNLNDWSNGFLLWRWESALIECEEIYNEAIKLGVKKEDARYILPQSCATKVNLCMNFQAWRDFLKNRTSKTAQWEIQILAKEIQNELNNIAPEIFEKADG